MYKTRYRLRKINIKKSIKLGKSDLKYTGIQIGFDNLMSDTHDSTWLLGGMIGHMNGKQEFENGKNTLNTYSISLYSSYFNNNDFYFDFFSKYSYLKNGVSAFDTENNNIIGHDNNQSATVSMEVGKKIHSLKTHHGNIYIEPNIQFSLSKMGKHNFKNSNGLYIEANSGNSKLFRAGTNISYFFSDKKSSIYTTIDFLKEFNGNLDFTLNGSPENLNLKNSWFQLGLGTTLSFKEHQYLFFEARTANNSKFKQHNFNIGYRVDF